MAETKNEVIPETKKVVVFNKGLRHFTVGYDSKKGIIITIAPNSSMEISKEIADRLLGYDDIVNIENHKKDTSIHEQLSESVKKINDLELIIKNLNKQIDDLDAKKKSKV